MRDGGTVITFELDGHTLPRRAEDGRREGDRVGRERVGRGRVRVGVLVRAAGDGRVERALEMHEAGAPLAAEALRPRAHGPPIRSLEAEVSLGSRTDLGLPK